MTSAGDVEIQRVALRLEWQPDPDQSHSLPLRARYLLEGMELHPWSMPPSGLLLLRKLEQRVPASLFDPKLGMLASGTMLGSGQSGMSERAGERVLHNAVEELYARAQRPSKGRPPPDAEVLYFLDRSELLACLILARVQGQETSVWVWKAAQKVFQGGTGVAGLLSGAPIEAPAALNYLAEWGVINVVSARIAREEVRALLAVLCEKHALSDLSQVLGLPRGDTASGALAPWNGWIRQGDALEELSPPLQVLWGVGLLLHQAPMRVRTRDALSELKRWWTAPAQVPTGDIQHGLSKEERYALSAEKVVGEADRTSSDIEGAYLSDAAALRQAFSAAQVQGPIPDPGAQAAPMWGPRAGASPEVGVPGRRPLTGEPSAFTGAAEADQARDEAAGSAREHTGATEPASRPDAFTSSSAQEQTAANEAADRSGTSAELARIAANRERHGAVRVDREQAQTSVFADRIAGQAADQIAQQVAALAAGVRTELAGSFYLVNLILRMKLLEREALLPWLERHSPWRLLEELTRALLQPLSVEDLADPLWAALASLRGGSEEVPDFERSISSTALVEEVQTWLLALLTQTGEVMDLKRDLLHVPARLCVSACHVDVCMRLADIRLPVRLAGLDVDPGWQPAFGRVVLFHFQ